MSKDNSGTRSADLHEICQAVPAPSRRGLLAGAGLAGGAIARLFVTGATAAGASATLERLKGAERDPAHRVLLKGGTVLSLDPQVGDFANGDVLLRAYLRRRWKRTNAPSSTVAIRERRPLKNYKKRGDPTKISNYYSS